MTWRGERRERREGIPALDRQWQGFTELTKHWPQEIGSWCQHPPVVVHILNMIDIILTGFSAGIPTHDTNTFKAYLWSSHKHLPWVFWSILFTMWKLRCNLGTKTMELENYLKHFDLYQWWQFREWVSGWKWVLESLRPIIWSSVKYWLSIFGRSFDI